MPSQRAAGTAGRPIDNSGCLIPFGGLFAIVGIGLAISAATQGPVRARDTGLRLMMAVIFGLSGTVVLVWGVAGRRATRQIGSLAKQHPDEPWLWRADWAQGVAEPESNSQFLTYGLMGLVFLLVSAPAFLNFKRELIERHNFAILIALVFPLAGMYLIGNALLGRVRSRKFGAIFRMAPSPGIAGGHLRGSVESKFSLPPGQAVDLTLSCVRAYRSGRDRWEDVLWQDKMSASATLGPLGSSIPVDFEIPFDSKETDSRNPDNEIFWRLAAARKLPGFDFKAAFRVPVFKTAASDPSLTAGKIEEEAITHVGDAQPAGSRIRVGPSPDGGIQYHLGAARTKGVAAAFMAFGIIFGAGGFFFGWATHGSFGWFIGTIPILIGVGFGMLLLMFSLSLWFSTDTIRIASGELHLRSTFLGIARTKVVRAAEIERFELYPGMRSGNQVWYDLQAYLRAGGKLTAGSGLEKKEAEWLEGEIRKNLGLNSGK